MWSSRLAVTACACVLAWSSAGQSLAQEYPQASLDQATRKTVFSLNIERYKFLNEEGIEAEYQWTRDMALLCLANPDELQGREGWEAYAIEYQRHAGRIARYRGFGLRAIEDYETAFTYLYEVAPYSKNLERTISLWEATIWRDIADTYLLVGALSDGADVSVWILDQMRERGESPPGGSSELYRLAFIAEIEGRYEECLRLARQIVEWDESFLDANIAEYPELLELSSGQSWDLTVRLPDYEHLMARLLPAERPGLNAIRAAYCFLGRALRVNGRLGDAGEALKTATRTPWRCEGTCRDKLDYEVDREWAFLALAQGEPGEALVKAEFCLGEYALSPAEKIELLDLVSRAKEALGDVEGAMEALEEAIGIVEGRRANLVTDVYKQSFVSGYAPLYRRALDLSLLRNADFGLRNGCEPEAISTDHEPRSTSDASRFTNDEGRPTEASAATAFQWAERLKGRAMLDAINRYDQRMAHAVATSDTAEMKRIRDLAGRVCSVSEIQKLLPPDTALIEYAFGGGELRITNYELRSEEKSKSRRLEKEGSRREEMRISDFGLGNEPEPEAIPTNDESRTTNHTPRPTSDASRFTSPASRAYLWVVTKDGVSFQRLEVSGGELDRLCSMLSGALASRRAGTAGRGAGRYRDDDSWVDPAARLYELTIKPVAACLNGIRRLVVVGDGPLNTIPFEVLIASRDSHPDRALKHHLLIEDFTISYAPSGTLLKIIQEKQQTRNWDQSLWAFASTKFGAAAPDSSVAPGTSIRSYQDILRSARSLELRDLPYTRREVEELSRYFRESPHRTVIDGENMKEMLLAASTSGELGKVRFLHFATHAVHPTDRPYLSGLVLSPPFPVETDEKNEDREEGSADQDHRAHAQSKLDSILKQDKRGWRPELLTLGELSKLKLNSELVVLSACDTLGKDMIDGDWINGLARSFLMAGSSGVICTLWEAADRNTANVMPAIYQALMGEDGPDGTDVPRALQRFKCARLGFPKHAHPSTWAPYVYHGRIVNRP